jgi:hypothetical protein
LPIYNIVYKIDGSVHTVVEIVRQFRNTLRDCFEDKHPLHFELRGQTILPDVPKITPKMEYNFNINNYSDVIFILEEYNKKKNVKYVM